MSGSAEKWLDADERSRLRDAARLVAFAAAPYWQAPSFEDLACDVGLSDSRIGRGDREIDFEHRHDVFLLAMGSAGHPGATARRSYHLDEHIVGRRNGARARRERGQLIARMTAWVARRRA